MFHPIATYRVQLNSSFTLQHLQKILPYLHRLGISTIYAAPITQSDKDSAHGYDVVNPGIINPQIGTAEELENISRQLRQFGMNWLQDIVPNHMAFSAANTRLMDVLERGPHSPYYHYFDIDWDHPDPLLNGKLMVPFLGSEAETALRNGEIKLALAEQGLVIQYFDNTYPLSLPAYRFIVAQANGNNTQLPLQQLEQAVEKLEQQAATLSLPQWLAYKQQLLRRLEQEPQWRTLLQQCTAHINTHMPLLQQLLQQQYYTLSWWRDTEKKINYRRFFTVNSLICLRMEEEAVFLDYHQRIFELYKKHLVQGLRIDHIDGLYNPMQYIDRLRKSLGDDCYIIAEKILEYNESLPENWALQGTSGYEFLSVTNQLLTNRAGGEKLLRFYKELVPDMPAYSTLVFRSKHRFLMEQMAGELDNLLRYLETLQLTAGVQTPQLRDALAVWMAALPVYRLYPDGTALDDEAQELVRKTFETASRHAPHLQQGWMLLKSLFEPETDPLLADKKHLFLMRLMQFTGPLAAKGVEDTCFYLYNPLIALNEVGDSPARLGTSIDDFHNKMVRRQQNAACSLNTTSTHDTKRGEDARLRIAALSMLPDNWMAKVREWMTLNQPLVQHQNGRRMPSVNDEYFIYQSLVGSFPASAETTDDFRERSRQFIVKALREAKKETQYADPDTAYEEACTAFITQLLQPGHPFLQSFLPLFNEVLEYALVYSLAETLIKITAPGIPDIYQGSELMNTSYVDPDNRRPVDYTAHSQWLEKLEQQQAGGNEALLPWLDENKRDGVQKMFVIHRLLQFRHRNRLLFLKGEYLPLKLSEDRLALAYARRLNRQWIIVCIPLGRTMKEAGKALQSTAGILLPEDSPVQWTNLFTGETCRSENNRLPLQEVLGRFPVACLVAE
jgi:(1->4)-alpha-D-glucan 1-alpha-D-glucosylmutase